MSQPAQTAQALNIFVLVVLMGVVESSEGSCGPVASLLLQCNASGLFCIAEIGHGLEHRHGTIHLHMTLGYGYTPMWSTDRFLTFREMCFAVAMVCKSLLICLGRDNICE